ncbi:hypothetical protein M0802_012895 [Mischocyttarus mexicanus]|nr:hypothetical protein M0802_012895 [Mischocyttarus mexicanus]
MGKLLCTIWALMLNSIDVSIFKTCFANAMEDDFGEPLITGPPITSFLFAAGVYVIVAQSTLFPQSFRKPNPMLLCIYEFLTTAFFLEFSIACIWTPIDVLMLTTLPKAICHTLQDYGYHEVAETFVTNKSSMAALSYGTSTTFFLLALYVTNTVDYTILTDRGLTYFGSHLKNKLWQQIKSELPKSNEIKSCSCKPRKKKRSKSRGLARI